MRIVSGSAGGVRLLVPKTDLRPTMDRVKGALFDSLGSFLTGARVLDLFAGSGALRIEALSRGAASATLVEKDPRAVSVIRANLEKTKLQAGARVITADIFSFLHRLPEPASFDLILADPPYAKAPGERDFGVELLSDPALARALAPGGWFVLEKLPGVPIEPVCQRTGWELTRERRYGATAVAFLRRAERPPADSDSPPEHP